MQCIVILVRKRFRGFQKSIPESWERSQVMLVMKASNPRTFFQYLYITATSGSLNKFPTCNRQTLSLSGGVILWSLFKQSTVLQVFFSRATFRRFQTEQRFSRPYCGKMAELWIWPCKNGEVRCVNECPTQRSRADQSGNSPKKQSCLYVAPLWKGKFPFVI